MTINLGNPLLLQAPYVITSRTFPFDETLLPAILSKMYFELANAINSRTIGIYDQSLIASGNIWFNTGIVNSREQSFRQVYTISSLLLGTNTIPLGINVDSNTIFVNISGTAQSTSVSVALTPWISGPLVDAPYLRVNIATGNIEIITTTANWVTFSAVIVIELILNN